MAEYKLNPLNPRPKGSRSPKDYKEKDYTEEVSGDLRFVAPREHYGYDSGAGSSRSIKTSDDYKKGGKISSASSRADGCCTKGKTKGRMV